MTARRAVWLIGVAGAVFGCSRPPPVSQFPSPRAAIDRMRATHACSRGLEGEAKVDYFGKGGRVRGNALFKVARPERVRLDVFSPFGATLSTLTVNGERFSLLDFKSELFFHGPPSECNVLRFLHVPVPPQALVRLLSGEAPVLVHQPGAATIRWTGGRYRIDIASKHDARQRIALEPNPDDWALPWQRQRVRVREIEVEQKGVTLYRAKLDEHAPARMAEAWVDPVGLEPDVPPSGPECHAEVPRRLRFVVPTSDQDVVFLLKDVMHNPPLVPGSFRQRAPEGVEVRYAPCR